MWTGPGDLYNFNCFTAAFHPLSPQLHVFVLRSDWFVMWWFWGNTGHCKTGSIFGTTATDLWSWFRIRPSKRSTPVAVGGESSFLRIQVRFLFPCFPYFSLTITMIVFLDSLSRHSCTAFCIHHSRHAFCFHSCPLAISRNVSDVTRCCFLDVAATVEVYSTHDFSRNIL